MWSNAASNDRVARLQIYNPPPPPPTPFLFQCVCVYVSGYRGTNERAKPLVKHRPHIYVHTHYYITSGLHARARGRVICSCRCHCCADAFFPLFAQFYILYSYFALVQTIPPADEKLVLIATDPSSSSGYSSPIASGNFPPLLAMLLFASWTWKNATLVICFSLFFFWSTKLPKLATWKWPICISTLLVFLFTQNKQHLYRKYILYSVLTKGQKREREWKVRCGTPFRQMRTATGAINLRTLYYKAYKVTEIGRACCVWKRALSGRVREHRISSYGAKSFPYCNAPYPVTSYSDALSITAAAILWAN